MKDRILIGLVALYMMWLTLPTTIVAQRNTDPCRLFADGTKIRDPDDCSQEIVCKDFKSTPGMKCTGSKPFYNKDQNKCETHLSDHSTCEINCKNMTNKFVPDPKTCYGYYYCQDEDLALHGHCPHSYHFDQIQQMCIYDFNSTCSINKLNFCAVVKKDVKFKDESNCGKYNECIEHKLTKHVTLESKYCPEATPFYHPEKGKCLNEPTDGCHPLPKNVCGTTGKNIKKNVFVSDGYTCGGSFFCADYGNKSDPNPQWYKCPDNLFFNEEKNMCMDPLDVVCFKDRCEGSQRKFVVSSKSGCRHYLWCENGVKMHEQSCGNTFFDEERGICTTEMKPYGACYHNKSNK